MLVPREATEIETPHLTDWRALGQSF